MKTKRFLSFLFAFVLVLNLSAFPVSATEMPETMEAAAVTLREGIKNWENLVTVTFTVDAGSFSGTTAAANTLAQQVLDLALAHTGAPDEGDYLRFNIGYMEPNSVNFGKQGDSWQFTVTYYFAYWTTPEQESELDERIEELVQALDLRNDQLTAYQKVCAIYNYICGNVVYDYENLHDDSYGLKFTTYAAVVNKTAVCQGYATLFYRLCLEAGVDNRIITGEGINNEGQPERHAWNLVELDGQYYCLDSTWDAGMYDYWYFLKSNNDFYNHTPDPQYLSAEFMAKYPVAAQSYEHPTMENMVDGDYEYRVVNGQSILLKYNGTEQHVTVPATLGGYPLYVIGMEAFYRNNHILSLTFSEGIRLMETCAIVYCANLKSVHLPSTMNFTASNEPDFLCRVICGPYMCPNVETITVAEGNPYLTVHDGVLYNKEMTILRCYPAGDTREVFQIPEGVLSIGASAFAGNEHLKEVIMPDTVVRIQMGAFEYCSNLEKINISTSCRWIDQYVFSGTALEAIHIPASVTTLYFGSFGLHSKVKTITVDPDNPVYYVQDGILYANMRGEYLVSSCHIPGTWLVKYPVGGEETSFTVPEGVVFIDQLAFGSCIHLREIHLPDSLEVLYCEAFWGCGSLASLEFPDNLREIHDSVFMEVNGLVTLVIPASVEFMGYNVITSIHLENVVFLGDAPELFDNTFGGVQNLNVYYPAGNTTWEPVIQMFAHQPGLRFIEMCETHQFESASRKASGCTVSGFEGRRCTVCGLVEVDTIIPARGHSLDEQGQCTYCGYGSSHSNGGGQTYSPISTEEQQEMLKVLLITLALFCAVIVIPVVIVNMVRRRKEKRK